MFLSATLNSPVGSSTSSLDPYAQIIVILNISCNLKKLREVRPYEAFNSSLAIP